MLSAEYATILDPHCLAKRHKIIVTENKYSENKYKGLIKTKNNNWKWINKVKIYARWLSENKNTKFLSIRFLENFNEIRVWNFFKNKNICLNFIFFKTNSKVWLYNISDYNLTNYIYNAVYNQVNDHVIRFGNYISIVV